MKKRGRTDMQIASSMFVNAVGLASVVLAGWACATEPSDFRAWVHKQTGNLPIIISAPHGGTGSVPNVDQRLGENIPTGAKGFVTARDIGTEELAVELSAALASRFGEVPYGVWSLVHRKFIDPNRPPEIAFEDPDARPVYDHYHSSLVTYCREVTNRFHKGLLIDIHGQGSRRDTVFRGTKNGLTVQRLRDSFGQSAHHGPESLFGLLQARGWTVHPDPLTDPEQSEYSGGHIVRFYGSHQGSPIDAIQLEFGSAYRVPSRRKQTARILADALVEYAARYLGMPKAIPAIDPDRLQHRSDDVSDARRWHTTVTKVAVFDDQGVSSTEALLEVLDGDVSLLVGKISAEQIRAGGLKNYSVLVFPGGSGSAQGKALDELGREKVRQFVRGGRGLVGICAGAYLATCDYEWSLNVFDAKVIDRPHWNRGSGNVQVKLTELGRKHLGQPTEQLQMYYHQGPLLAPGNNPDIPDFQPLGIFASEIAKNGAPSGVMMGTTAMGLGNFADGRVVCFSTHPEKSPQHRVVLLNAIYWSAGSQLGNSNRP